MQYDSEASKKFDRELVSGFKHAFPLVDERDLPRTPAQIKQFLAERVATEVKEGIRSFQSRIVRVLCEVSEPKNHVEDMARIVVNEAMKVPGLNEQLRKKADEVRLLMGRLEWLSGRLKTLHPEISEAIGLKKEWRNIFTAIDEARELEKEGKEVAP